MIVVGLRVAELRRVRSCMRRQIDHYFRCGLSPLLYDFLLVCTWTDVTCWRTT
jgi:hypothetical protein